MKNKRSLLKVGALLYSIVWAIGWIGIIGNIAVAVFTDRISSNGVAIYTEVYNGGFALLPPIFLILFCFSIFLLTTEKKAKNLNELLH